MNFGERLHCLNMFGKLLLLLGRQDHRFVFKSGLHSHCQIADVQIQRSATGFDQVVLRKLGRSVCQAAGDIADQLFLITEAS